MDHLYKSDLNMAPKLYMFNCSPNCRSVLLLEYALGIRLKYVKVDITKGEQFKPEFLKLNPQHCIPVLEDENGNVLLESRAIMPYLVAKYASDDSLYPEDLLKRAVVEHRLFFDTGSLQKSLGECVKRALTGNVTIPDEVKLEANGYYEILDGFLNDNNWVAGPAITIADFSLLATVTSLDVFIPIDVKYRNIIEWIRRAEALPYYSSNRVGLEIFANLLHPTRK